MEGQTSGVVGTGPAGMGTAMGTGSQAQGEQGPALPERPQQARLPGGISGLLGRFRR
jgi:hypothetical protein